MDTPDKAQWNRVFVQCRMLGTTQMLWAKMPEDTASRLVRDGIIVPCHDCDGYHLRAGLLEETPDEEDLVVKILLSAFGAHDA